MMDNKLVRCPKWETCSIPTGCDQHGDPHERYDDCKGTALCPACVPVPMVSDCCGAEYSCESGYDKLLNAYWSNTVCYNCGCICSPAEQPQTRQSQVPELRKMDELLVRIKATKAELKHHKQHEINMGREPAQPTELLAELSLIPTGGRGMGYFRGAAEQVRKDDILYQQAIKERDMWHSLADGLRLEAHNATNKVEYLEDKIVGIESQLATAIKQRNSWKGDYDLLAEEHRVYRDKIADLTKERDAARAERDNLIDSTVSNEYHRKVVKRLQVRLSEQIDLTMKWQDKFHGLEEKLSEKEAKG